MDGLRHIDSTLCSAACLIKLYEIIHPPDLSYKTVLCQHFPSWDGHSESGDPTIMNTRPRKAAEPAILRLNVSRDHLWVMTLGFTGQISKCVKGQTMKK